MFVLSETARRKYSASKYQHFVSGHKFTRKEKILIAREVGIQVDKLLYANPSPITKVLSLYENKNNQDLMEYIVKRDDEILNYVLGK